MPVTRIVSDFNAETLGRILSAKGEEGEAVEYRLLGDMQNGLLEPQACNLVLVWIRAEAVIPAFASALAYREADHDQVLREVDGFADLLLSHADLARTLAIATWILPPDVRGYGILDWRPGLGLSHLLARMNQRLADRLTGRPNIFLLDSSRWAPAASPRLWLNAKIPYALAVFKNAAEDIVRLRQALVGRSRRLVILDLDGTLWGGVIGETGWEGIRLGGHDMTGEAFVEFQKEVKGIRNLGIQLAIASKNDEETALKALAHHDAMVLKKTDFSAWRINWRDKAENIRSLLQEINLTAGSAVFIDNEPAERARVREAIPDLLVPEWPEDPALYVQAFRQLACFDLPVVSREDRARTAMSQADKERRAAAEAAANNSQEDWLASIGMTLAIGSLSKANIARASQLLNKTNQMNLASRRLTEAELSAWSRQEGCRVWVFSLADKFGDMGLIGLMSARIDGTMCEIVDFLISCRVMGRGVEDAMLATASGWATEHRCETIVAHFRPTERNRPFRDYLEKAAPSGSRGERYVWAAGSTPSIAGHFTIVSTPTDDDRRGG